ncbi:MAG: ATP-binding protein, partial [Promethearchaeota archaeon]
NNITILVNPAMEKILGYSKDELIGHSVKEFLSDESHDIFEIETQKRIMRGTPSAVYELTFIKKNGEPVVTRVAATVLLNHLNEPIGSFGVFSDISLQKHLEKEREDLEARRAEFMALASHELRTPLTNISGFFDVLRKRENNITLEEKARCYDIISNNIQRLQGLISSVGELTRIEQGFFQLNIESVNLVNFIIELFHSYNVRLGAQFKYSVPQKETQVKIIIDPQRVSQALDNILQNAINHSAEENRQIVAKCEVLLDTVEITVADNGAGIDPENLERIFEAFVSIPSKYSIQGTGVGLYLAKTIVEAHGGKIRAYSEGKDKGSTLRISLPRNSDFSNFNYDITSP